MAPKPRPVIERFTEKLRHEGSRHKTRRYQERRRAAA